MGSCRRRRKEQESSVLIFYLFYINGFITKRNYDVNFMYHSLTRFYTKPSRTQDETASLFMFLQGSLILPSFSTLGVFLPSGRDSVSVFHFSSGWT